MTTEPTRRHTRRSEQFIIALAVVVIMALAGMFIITTTTVITNLNSLEDAAKALNEQDKDEHKRGQYSICTDRFDYTFERLIANLIIAYDQNTDTKPWIVALKIIPNPEEVCEPLLPKGDQIPKVTGPSIPTTTTTPRSNR